MKRDAFTMVELIFVIVIIGILTAVAIPKLNSTTLEARKSNLTSFIDTLDKTVGPTMYAEALGKGETSITSSGADLCKNLSTYTQVPDGVSMDKDCVITVDNTKIPSPASGLTFTDSTATSAPSWAKLVW